MTATETITSNAAQFRTAMESGGYRLTDADIRGFFDGGWSEFEAECRVAGVDPEETLDAIVAELLASAS